MTWRQLSQLSSIEDKQTLGKYASDVNFSQIKSELTNISKCCTEKNKAYSTDNKISKSIVLLTKLLAAAKNSSKSILIF